MALAKKPFVVIDSEILSSSIWTEDAHTRLVWLTLLILCDTDGYVGAAVPGIAHAAGVTLEQCQAALKILQAPDEHSRTQAHEGRRVETVERGFTILNFRDHLDRLSVERKKARDRVFRHRQRKKQAEADKALHGVTGNEKSECNVTDATGRVTVAPGSREKGPEKRDKQTTTDPQSPKAPAPPTPVVPASDWNREAADDFRAVYSADPPKLFFAQVKPVAQKYGWAKTRPALKAYMSETPIDYLNVAKCLAVKVEGGGSSIRGKTPVADRNDAVITSWAQEVREGKR